MEAELTAYVTAVFIYTPCIIDAQYPVKSQSSEDCLVPQMPGKEKQLTQIFFP